MRMHLLEETTVRTEWTRAPGPVDAYEIQFIPMVRGSKGEGLGSGKGRKRVHTTQEVTLVGLQMAALNAWHGGLNFGPGQLGY